MITCLKGSIHKAESNYELFLKRQSLDFTKAQRRFQYQMRRAHNFYRSLHCAPPLTLDDNLSRSAQLYAEQLAETNQFQHSDAEDYGENLFMMTSTNKIEKIHGANATRSWYDEIKFYDFDNPHFSPATGHFTQVIWRESKKLGVGLATGRDKSRYTYYVVAQYSPAGNMDGSFSENVLSPPC